MTKIFFEASLHFTPSSKQDLLDNNIHIDEVYDVLNHGQANRFGEHLVFLYKGLEVRTCSKAFMVIKVSKFQGAARSAVSAFKIPNAYDQAMTL